jgi:hypothetical protein
MLERVLNLIGASVDNPWGIWGSLILKYFFCVVIVVQKSVEASHGGFWFQGG